MICFGKNVSEKKYFLFDKTSSSFSIICKQTFIEADFLCKVFLKRLVITILERLDKKMHEDFMWFS